MDQYLFWNIHIHIADSDKHSFPSGRFPLEKPADWR